MLHASKRFCDCPNLSNGAMEWSEVNWANWNPCAYCSWGVAPCALYNTEIARLSKPLAVFWDLAVQTVSLAAMQFHQSESPLRFLFKAFEGFKCPRLPYGVKKV